MSGPAVDATLFILDEAFEPAEPRPANQSLVPNLLTVDDETWHSLPPGASRSIRDIVIHVGGCKYVYENHAFGDRSLSWDSKLVDPWPDSEPHMNEVLDWLRAGHRRVRHRLESLTDDDLEVPRKAPWAEHLPTRWLLNTLIQHDLYHAGEINHIRSLLAGDDRWAHERELAAH
ncbi:MAG: DinB family protein [Tepidiformaceae bacterium]